MTKIFVVTSGREPHGIFTSIDECVNRIKEDGHEILEIQPPSKRAGTIVNEYKIVTDKRCNISHWLKKIL